MTVSSLTADWLTAWQREIAVALERILRSFESTYGYPPGDNEALLADDESRADMARLEEVANIPPTLIAFYTTIAEISLPDIDHGYFIHPPGLIRDHIFEYGPVRVTENATGIVFGSDGGGIVFALDRGGVVHRSTTASWFDDFEVSAPTLAHFLERLRQAIAEYAAR